MANFGALLFCANNIIYITQPSSHCTPARPPRTVRLPASTSSSPFPNHPPACLSFCSAGQSAHRTMRALRRVESSRVASGQSQIQFAKRFILSLWSHRSKLPWEVKEKECEIKRDRECAQEQCWHMRAWRRQWNIYKNILFSTHLLYKPT